MAAALSLVMVVNAIGQKKKWRDMLVRCMRSYLYLGIQKGRPDDEKIKSVQNYQEKKENERFSSQIHQLCKTKRRNETRSEGPSSFLALNPHPREYSHTQPLTQLPPSPSP